MSETTIPRLTLDERRKLLKQAEQVSRQTPSTDESSQEQALAYYRSAITGASEEERKSLDRTLPASRLFKAEGPTRRACLVLAGLGTAKNVADHIFSISSTNHPDHQHWAAAADDIYNSVFDGAHDRDVAWLYDFIDVATREYWRFSRHVWILLRRLILIRELTPRTPDYLRRFVHMTSVQLVRSYAVLHGSQAQHVTPQMHESQETPEVVDVLLADESLIENEFWALFSVEPLGSDWLLTDNAAPGWNAAITTLSQTRPGFRERILDESLKGLLRDFAAKNVIWYHRVHRLLDPTADEIVARESLYDAVLQATPSTSVGLAQDMLARISISDVEMFLDASMGVMQRAEKKLLKAQIGLLKKVVKANPSFAGRVSELITGVLDGLPIDVAAQARALVIDASVPSRHSARSEATSQNPSSNASDAKYVPTEGHAPTTPTLETIAPPRLTDLPDSRPEPPPIVSQQEFLELIAEHIEGHGHGADIPRLLTYMSNTPPPTTSPTALIQRVGEIFRDVWDYGDISPRLQLASLLLTWVGDDSHPLEFKGYRRFIYNPSDNRSYYQPVETHSPTALLANVMKQTQLTLRHQTDDSATPTDCGILPWSRSSRNTEATDAALPTPIAATTMAWRRILAVPGEGRYGSDRVLGSDLKPFWTHLTPIPLSKRASFAELALDVADVPAEFTFRAQIARDQDGFDQIVQWAAWLYRDNPDTLAAHAHPMLCAAVQVVNVRGVGPLLTALGESRHQLAGPSYSALALGLSAKMTEHRAQAAEAVASLALSGLLHPECLAAQIQAHLSDNFVMAGRVALGLADAASINAIAGYRVLQTLVTMLPDTGNVTSGAKLVELAARLASDYGICVGIPDVLAPKTKGNSVMSVALRALAAVQPHATPLAAEAAQQAEVLDLY